MKTSEPFYLVWNRTTKNMHVRCEHETLSEARKEALRLAEKQPGNEFFFLEAVGRACATSTVHVECETLEYDPDVPPIEETIADIFKDVPAEAWDSVPDSGSLTEEEIEEWDDVPDSGSLTEEENEEWEEGAEKPGPPDDDEARRIIATESLTKDLPEGTIPVIATPSLSDAEYERELRASFQDDDDYAYVTRIFTPHRHKDGDHITLRVYSDGALCDEGHTFRRCGVPLLREQSRAARLPVMTLMESCNIKEDEGVLTMPRPDDWSQTQHVDQFCKAILRIAELLKDEW